jgi:CubicO group peptidase (beta-lactamase class C family)
MKTRILLLLACSAASFAAIHFAADKADPAGAGMDAARLAKIPVRMKRFVDDGKAAGIVTLVARHGHVAGLAAVGYQDREKQIPMRTDSMFQIMSMTKPVTCAGIMILVDEGELSLIDPVDKYLPEFKGKKITIRDLMTHTSGVPALPPKGFDKNSHTLAEVVSAAAQQPLDFEPGSNWSYSNMGIATLGRITEVVSKQPFEKFIGDRMFTPLGMKDSHFFLPVEKQGRLAVVYTDDNGTLVRSKDDAYRAGWKYPMPEGGMYSTASDMARFYQMMLDKGALDGHRILSAAAVEVMTSVHTGDLKTGFAPGLSYGLGWAVVRDPLSMLRFNSKGTFSHGGAYRTYGWVDPGKDMLGVLMLQRTNGGGDVADEINSFLAMSAAAIER